MNGARPQKNVNPSNMRKSSDIPKDQLADILSRLPSATVLRFKLVSKTWNALISDPTFIRLHSKRVSPSPKILLSLALIVHSQLRILDPQHPSFEAVGPLVFPREKPHLNPFKVIGSSFGLVCVATSFCGSFYLWNPTTRESRKIPDFSRIYINHYDYLHGLGYDPVSNDFKVVISLYPVDYVPKLSITYHVYSLKKNSWKKIVSPLQYYYNPSKFPSEWQLSTRPATTTQSQDSAATTLAVVLNGVLHWLVRFPNEFDPHIIAFDSSSEKFRKLRIPDQKVGKLQMNAALPRARGIVTLLEHKGMLCLFCPKSERWDEKEIWVMKKYGNHKSWTHLHDVFGSASGIESGSLYKPLCITGFHEVVIHTPYWIKRWSTKKPKAKKKTGGVSRPPGQLWTAGSTIFGAALVEETLISPFGITARRKPNYFSLCFGSCSYSD